MSHSERSSHVTGRQRLRTTIALSTAALLAASLAACGGSSGNGGSDTLTVTYQQFGDSKVQANFLKGVKKEFEASHKGITVDLQPISASEDDYYTKLQLQMRSAKTSPDLVYEDTFLINSDIEAGYLRPLDDNLEKWDDWSQFEPSAKKAAQALDGKTYGVPDGTDTRALWYNKKIFAKAGLPTDWQPKTWDDLLTAARAIKSKVPGVTPMNLYVGTGVGEAATMQGFEMLLYGTERLPLRRGLREVGGRQPGLRRQPGVRGDAQGREADARCSRCPEADVEQHRPAEAAARTEAGDRARRLLGVAELAGERCHAVEGVARHDGDRADADPER